MDGYAWFFVPFRIVADEAVKGLVRSKEGFRFFHLPSRFFFWDDFVWICTSFGSICMDFCTDLGEVGSLFFFRSWPCQLFLQIFWGLCDFCNPPNWSGFQNKPASWESCHLVVFLSRIH